MEIYDTDLEILRQVFTSLENVSMINRIGEVEIRVRISENSDWAVVGWDEVGDPCVLRFEKDPVPFTIGKIDAKGQVHPFTINQAKQEHIDPPLKDYDTRF